MCRMLSGRKQQIVREVCRAGSPSQEPCCVIPEMCGQGWLSWPGARAGCPGRELECLKPAGTGEGVSADIYLVNSLGDRAKEGRRSDRRHAGTGEGISARIHASILQGDRAMEGRRSACRHNVNSLGAG